LSQFEREQTAKPGDLVEQRFLVPNRPMKLTGDIVETLKVLKTENAVGYKLKLK